MMRIAKITLAVLAATILTGFIALACYSGAVTDNVNFKTPKLQSTQQKLKNLNLEYDSLNHQLLKLHSTDQKKIDKLNSDKKQLEKQRQDLQKQLQAKAEAKQKLQVAAANAANTVTATSTASAEPLSSGCGDNFYANYIYSHESGCRLYAVNPIGACGLGQALPCSKLSSVCPNWQNDYPCQNAFFTSYANGKGGWAGAYNFWLAHSWW